MKKPTVNLLPTATRFQLSQIRLAKKLKKVAFILAIVWLVLIIGITTYRLILSNKEKSLVKEKKDLETSLNQLMPQAALQQSLRLRLKLVAEVLKGRVDWAERTRTILSLIPEDARVDFLKAKGKEVELGGRIYFLSDLVQFEEKVNEVKKAERYEELTLSSLSRSSDYWNFFLKIVEEIKKEEK